MWVDCYFYGFWLHKSKIPAYQVSGNTFDSFEHPTLAPHADDESCVFGSGEPKSQGSNFNDNSAMSKP